MRHRRVHLVNRDLDALVRRLRAPLRRRWPVGRNRGPCGLAAWLIATAAAGAGLVGGAPLRAQAVCQGSNISYFGGGNDTATPHPCSSSGIVCQVPIVTSGPTYALDSGCDPTATNCGMTVTIGMHFTGNHNNAPYFNVGYSFEEVDLRTSSNSLLGECGYAGEELQPDFGTVIVTGSVHCGTPSTYTVNLISCPSCPSCPPSFIPPACTLTTPVALDLTGHAGCPAPPPDFCGEGAGAGGGAGGPGDAASGARMATAGSKGNGPDSGAAGTTGNGNCSSCKSLGSSSGDGTRKVRVKQITGECPACGAANPSYTYGDPGNPLLPTTVTDGKSVATVFAYDANGRQLSKIETAQTTPTVVQRQTSWMYNPTFPAFVAKVTGPFSPPAPMAPAGTRATVLAYDAKGNLQASTVSGSEATYPSQAFSLQTAYSNYSAAGLPGLIDPPDVPSTTADATSYTFNSGVTNGYLVATRSDPVVGAAPLNAVTLFQYDAFNRVTDVTDVNGMRTHTTYDALNRVLTVTQGFGSPQSLITTYSYNTLGDLVCVQLPAGNALAYAYDGAGRLTDMARQASCAATQPLEQTLYTLDAVGHRIQEVRQRIVSGSAVTDATTSYAYTTTCHLDSMTAGDPNMPSLQSTTSFAYDCDNNLLTVNDPNHPSPAAPSTSYSYDPLNRLTQVTQPWGGAGGGMAVTTYAYDLEDHLAVVTDSERNQTTYVTSDRDLLTSQTSPVTGLTAYAYNAHGALVQQTDARGVVTTRQLDAADRPTQVTYSGDPTLTTTYAYDTTTASGTSPIGRLSSITKGSGTSASVVAYTYDLFGRTLQDGNLGYTYDPNGNRTSIAYPGNVTACYAYDVADRQVALSYSTATGANVCQRATTPIVTSTPAAPTVYASAGPLQQLHLANGLAETHSFDQRYYPTGITAGTLLAWTSTTDGMGNITGISPGRTFSYQDFQYFLTQANSPTLWGTRTWAYDTIGNRLSEDRGGGANDTYAYQPNAASPHGDTPLLNTVTLANNAGTKYLAYDLAGNVLLEASPTSHLDFTPDAAGKLSRMTEETSHETSTLTYDGRGFLAKARNAVTDCGPLATVPTYDSEGLLYQRQQQNLFTSAVSAQTRIFYFAGRPIAQLDGSPATGMLTYLTVDHLGTPVLASSGAATAIWSGGFEPFGRDFTTPSAQSSGIFLRLPGQWDDTAWDNTRLTSGLYYNVSRWLKTGTGRYISSDLIGLDGDINLYSYAWESPTKWADPLGLSPRPVPPSQRGTRACDSEEMAACVATCSPRGVESCRISRTFRLVRVKHGLARWDWVDGPMSCSCDEDPFWLARRCVRNLKQNLNEIIQWLADHPPGKLPGPAFGGPLPYPVFP